MPDTLNLQSLADSIEARAKEKKHTIIALSGFGGAGKSTLARQLMNLLGQAEVVSLDDFILNRLANLSSDWSTGFDWKRLVEQVLQPLSEGKDTITYERYDWSRNEAIDSRTIQLPVYLIVEGVGLLREDLKKYFDITVWINVPLEIASERGKSRDREVYQVDHDALWANLWIPADKGYAEKHRPRENADFLLDGDSVKTICVDAFRSVRDIPYRIPLSLTETDECCTGKHKILLKKFVELGIPVRWRVCSFRWSDLKLPIELTRVPHENDSTHAFLEVNMNGRWIVVDATWDSALKDVLSINDWDGISDTPVAAPVIELFSLEKSKQIMENENPDETKKDLEKNGVFYDAFNQWLENVRRKTRP
jgi:uridine kinase